MAPTAGVWCSEPPGLSLDPTGHLAVYFPSHLSGWRQDQSPPRLSSAVLGHPVSLDRLLFYQGRFPSDS